MQRRQSVLACPHRIFRPLPRFFITTADNRPSRGRLSFIRKLYPVTEPRLAEFQSPNARRTSQFG